MKYTYTYKTRDEVFGTLRMRGIKPIKVVAAHGSKANGEVHGVRKHEVAGVAVTAAVVVGVVAFLAGDCGAAPRIAPPLELASLGGNGVRALPKTVYRRHVKRLRYGGNPKSCYKLA